MIHELPLNVLYEVLEKLDFEGLMSLFGVNRKLLKMKDVDVFKHLLMKYNEFDEKRSLEYLMYIYRKILKGDRNGDEIVLEQKLVNDWTYFQLHLNKIIIKYVSTYGYDAIHFESPIDYDPRTFESLCERYQFNIFITDKHFKIHCYRFTWVYTNLIDDYILNPEGNSMTIDEFIKRSTSSLDMEMWNKLRYSRMILECFK
jgi:hypothetical protein